MSVETNYFSITVQTRKVDDGIAIDVNLGVGISIDLGMDRFPGMPKTTLDGNHDMGGTTLTLKGKPSLERVAMVLEAYFKALKESAETRPIELPSEKRARMDALN